MTRCFPPAAPSKRRLFGLSKAAQKLSVGYQQWAMNNDFKNDTQLLFGSAALQQLHARIVPAERRDYLLTFGPVQLAADAEGAEEEHPAAHLGWRQYSINCLAGAGPGGKRGGKGRQRTGHKAAAIPGAIWLAARAMTCAFAAQASSPP